MKRTVLLFCLLPLMAFPQGKNDSILIRSLFTEVLTNGKCYQNLEYLCKKIGSRMSGTREAQLAVEYTGKLMREMGLDTVYLQEVMVPHWERGRKETASVITGGRSFPLSICALGGSIATPPAGLSAEVVEVHSFEDLSRLGKDRIKGKIVFFNRPMDPAKILTFSAYGGAVNQRGSGAVEAAKYGAAGVIVRSMTLIIDDHPHTGAMRYVDSLPKIPAAAISTEGAEQLSRLLRKDNTLKLSFRMSCRLLEEKKSYNVIGEIRGAERPDEIIAVGGHLDSWDLGDGAHDDGAGCMQSIEALRLFKALNIKPKRTLRAVMFMNEEFGLRGGKKYAEQALQKREKHVAAIESDAGGFSPRGFGMDMSPEKLEKVRSWGRLLEPYGIYELVQGGGGADIGPLEEQGVPVMGLRPDSQRYFDYHHAATDTFDKVNKRELELGSAAMAAMIYLISEYGL